MYTYMHGYLWGQRCLLCGFLQGMATRKNIKNEFSKGGTLCKLFAMTLEWIQHWRWRCGWTREAAAGRGCLSQLSVGCRKIATANCCWWSRCINFNLAGNESMLNDEDAAWKNGNCLLAWIGGGEGAVGCPPLPFPAAGSGWQKISLGWLQRCF